MTKCMERVKHIEISRHRRKQHNERATEEERTAFKSLASIINFFGSDALPQDSYSASWLQK